LLENLKPIPTYTSFEDINNGDFVFVRLHDPFLVLVWMGRIVMLLRMIKMNFSKW
jgi:hypothetical protein